MQGLQRDAVEPRGLDTMSKVIGFLYRWLVAVVVLVGMISISAGLAMLVGAFDCECSVSICILLLITMTWAWVTQ